MASNRIFVGSTKDILDLRKTVEYQTAQIQAQQEEILKLKGVIQNQQEKYCYLLDSNSKLWIHLQNLERQLSEKINSENLVEDKENTLLPNGPQNGKAKKKNKNTKTEKPLKKKKKELYQKSSASNIKEIPETLSQVQKFLNAHPSYAKDIEKVAKNIQEEKSYDSEEENEVETTKRAPRKGRHHHRDIVEKITLERKIYKKNNFRDDLSSTIDETLDRFGIVTSSDDDYRNPHHRRLQHLSSTPTIREVTSSSSSSERDNNLEDSEASNQSPVHSFRERRLSRGSDSEVTTMQDKFDDDEMSCSDSEPMPSPKNEYPRRQRVGDRLRKMGQ